MTARSHALDEKTVGEVPRDPSSSVLFVEPFLEVVFHPNMAFWGRVTELGALAPGRMLSLGRKTLVVDPTVLDAAGRPLDPVPLGDPCLSRDRVQIRFLEGTFHVLPVGESKDPVTCLTPSGAPWTPGQPCPPGTLLTVGSRLIVRLAHRISPITWRRWYTERVAPEQAREAAALGLVGESEAMWRLREKILSLPSGPADILITGPSGAGKELVAQAIHRVVRSLSAPYVSVNCAAIPGTLVESELFGYTPGAFSGASASDSGNKKPKDKPKGRDGAFREAHGGTIFLDEIAELPIEHQAKLNRVLEARMVAPLGGDYRSAQPIDVATISATWQNLDALVDSGRFREDLRFRVARHVVEVPSLESRREDIAPLIRRFVERLAAGGDSRERRGRRSLASVSEDPGVQEPLIPLSFVLAMSTADWTRNNVRELYNAVHRAAAAFCAGGRFELQGAPPGRPVAFEVAGDAERDTRTLGPPPGARKRKPAEIPAEEWHAAYAELGSVRLVAARFGIVASTADAYLKRAGVVMHPPNRRGRRRGE